MIDIHAHTSNHALWSLHTATATIEDLEKKAIQYNLSRICLLATYFPLKKSGLTNAELLKRVEGKKLFLVFGSLDVANNFFNGLEELERLFKEKAIVGIKLYPGYQFFYPSDRRYFPIYELAASYDAPIMFHGGELHECCSERNDRNKIFRCGFSYCRLKKWQCLSAPRAMVGAFKSFPKVKFIVSHLANPYFEELRQIMQRYSNVYTDISGQFVSNSAEDTEIYRRFIAEEIKKFLVLKDGMGRVMFGTDFPIQSYADTIDLVNRLTISPSDRNKIFHQNAEWVLNNF